MGIAMFSLYCVKGFYGFVMVAWLYGLFFGSYLYISKVFCYSLVRSRDFSRTWSWVQAAQALPSLLGISLTGFINQVSNSTSVFLLVSPSSLFSWRETELVSGSLYLVLALEELSLFFSPLGMVRWFMKGPEGKKKKVVGFVEQLRLDKHFMLETMRMEMTFQ